MLLLTAAVLVFASLSFGQGSNWGFYWHPAADPGWFPLTYEGTFDNPTSGTPMTGELIKVFLDDGDEDPTNDVQPPEGGGAAEWSTTTLIITDGIISPADNGNVIISSQTPAYNFYFVACCPDGSPLYYSASIAATPGIHSFAPITGWQLYPGAVPCVTECVGTEPNPYPIDVPEGPGGHADVDEPSRYFCFYLCEGEDLEIRIGPLFNYETPEATVLPGCDPSDTGCDDPECPDASFGYTDTWVFDPPGAEVGEWVNVIVANSDGCVCFCLDDILAVNLIGFDAVAGDASVELSWSAEEVGTDYYEVSRARLGHDANVIGTVNAGNGEYTFTDNDAENGVSYTYSLVEVDVNGNRTVLATKEGVTPSANLAVITEYALHQNYPNPFNPTTNIVFDVVEENRVELTVYNAVGQLVAKVADGVYGNGRHTVEFSSDNLTSGLYFYTVKIGDEFSATKKMLLVK
jgi:hypothetical protein